MNSKTTLQQESNAPFTHIFLSLDLLESEMMNEDSRSYLTIIRQHIERLKQLIYQNQHEIIIE